MNIGKLPLLVVIALWYLQRTESRNAVVLVKLDYKAEQLFLDSLKMSVTTGGGKIRKFVYQWYMSWIEDTERYMSFIQDFGVTIFGVMKE